jgi:hypothetical protein
MMRLRFDQSAKPCLGCTHGGLLQTRRETDAMLDKLAQSRLDAVQQVRRSGRGVVLFTGFRILNSSVGVQLSVAGAGY